MLSHFLILLLFFQAPQTATARAKALLEAGKLKEARAALAGADPAVPGNAYLLGLIDYRLHDYVPAARMLKAALPSLPEESPDYRETLRMIGQSEYQAGHMAPAIVWLEKARDAGAGGNEVLYMLGNSYLQARQLSKGRACFAAIFGVKPDSAAAHLYTAPMLMRQEFEDDAIRELEAALALDPKLPGAHFTLGEIAIYQAQIDRAIDQLHQEIAINPNFAMAYYRLGDAYTRRDDWAHAIPPLERAVWLDPTYSGPYILLGKSYLKTGDLTGAEAMLRRAVQLDPRNSSAHYLLGRVLIQSGRTEEGKKLLQKSQELKEGPGQ